MTLADFDRVIEAINALRTMRDTKEPRKLDEALTWRANDELAERMARDALTLLRRMREGAVEGRAAKDGSAWLRGDDHDNPNLVPALLITTPDRP